MDVSDKGGEILKVVVPSIKETAALVQNISISSEEQTNGVLQINTGMEQMNLTTQQNAGAAEELASTSDLLQQQAAGSRIEKTNGIF